MSLLHEAVHKNDKAMVLRLLKREGKGAVNKRDGSDQTPLHIASYEGKLEMANFLLSKGADVRALDKNGWSPLHSAATSGEFQIRYISLCIRFNSHSLNAQIKQTLDRERGGCE